MSFGPFPSPSPSPSPTERCPVPTARRPPPGIHTCTPQPCPHRRSPQSDLQGVKTLPLTASPASRSFLPNPLLESCSRAAHVRGSAGGGVVLELSPGVQDGAPEGGGLRLAVLRCGVSAATHPGIRCRPGLGLLEAQSRRSVACGRLPTGAAEPGTAESPAPRGPRGR